MPPQWYPLVIGKLPVPRKCHGRGAMATTQWVAREKNGILATCATDFEGFWQGTWISTKNVTQLVPSTRATGPVGSTGPDTTQRLYSHLIVKARAAGICVPPSLSLLAPYPWQWSQIFNAWTPGCTVAGQCHSENGEFPFLVLSGTTPIWGVYFTLISWILSTVR
ncbi:hypothetical protein DFH08DRAFT_827856 [Mycena albidolilacea]|uniref:Uncharacterized protein n=1 Tax=Mycena albidolilacea TaxID=1033008 RepID=A0AAD7E6X6_9AGAR|nr:hypothetical protein DFH08DRAFT_827856 [Mycena albidolilacea]